MLSSSKESHSSEDISKNSLPPSSTSSSADPWPSFSNLDTNSRQMIGPTSTFYNPDNIVSSSHDLDATYRTWLESFANDQQQQQQQQPQQHLQNSLTPTFQTSSQIPSLYDFVADQYTTPPSTIAIPSSDYTTTALHPSPSYQPPELYFYSGSDIYPHTPIDATPTTATFVSSKNSPYLTPTASTGGGSSPYTPRQGSTPYSAPSPDNVLLLPPHQIHFHSRSHPSVSSKPWTEDGGLATSTPGSASTSASAPAPAPAPSRPSPHARSTNASAGSVRITKPPFRPPSPLPPLAGLPTSGRGRGKRKRQKRNDNTGDGERESETPSEDEQDGGPEPGVGGSTATNIGRAASMGNPEPVVPTRLQGACTVCKRLKMKCDFPKDENTCKRCKAGGHVCVVEGRKPRTAPNKREYLLAQIRQKDAIIESLLKQLHNPYIATPLSIASYRMATSPSDQHNRNIVAWLDRMQSSILPPQGKPNLSGGKTAGMTTTTTFKLESRAAHGGGMEDDSDDASDHFNHGGLSDDAKDLADDEYGGGGGEGESGGDSGAGGSPQDPEKLQSLPDAAVPLGLIANLSLSNTKAKNQGGGRSRIRVDTGSGGGGAGAGGGGGDRASVENEDDDDDVGVANETYFMPGPATDLGMRASLIERHSPPEILVHGLVSPEEVDKLFDIFYTRVNPFISLLDPVLHTPASTFARCPFLFTVICAISSRYYPEKSEIYPIAMHFAKHSAANALIDGWKSVELCQAYIMMSIYAVPAKRWEEDRSWLYTGLAIRIATDLNLHQVSLAKPQNERQEREALNRTRVWMICFNLDRSTATQFGKPVTIKEDYIVRNSKEWYKKSQYNHPYDVHLCGYASLLRIVARFHDDIFSDPDSPTGLNRDVDFRAVTAIHDGHLTRYHEEWSKRFAQDSDPNDRASAFRCTLLPFLVGYSRLVMYSFGFQQAFQRGIEPGDHVFFIKCLEAAKSVVQNMIETLAPSGYMRFAPDGHFIFASFASAFLLKLLRPDFSNMLNKDQESEIFDLIGRLIQTFSSPEIAIDDRHTPRLYARFLAGLLSRHRRDGMSASRVYQPPPPPNPNPMARSSHGDYLVASSGSTSSAFSVVPPHQPMSAPSQTLGMPSSLDSGYAQSVYSQSEKSNTQTPPYQDAGEGVVSASAAVDGGGEGYVPSAAPMIEFDASFDLGLGSGMNGYGSSMLSEEEMLATMQALKNPAWWQTMMMPGFSWPDQANSRGIYNQGMNNLGMHNAVGFFPPEVSLQ